MACVSVSLTNGRRARSAARALRNPVAARSGRETDGVGGRPTMAKKSKKSKKDKKSKKKK
jgi:hypothetical protein